MDTTKNLEAAKKAGIADGMAVTKPNQVRFTVTKLINLLAYNDEKGFWDLFSQFRNAIGKKNTPNFICPVLAEFKGNKNILQTYLMALNNTLIKRQQ